MAYAALAVSLMALLFTVGSFWWLNARSGPLRAYEPTTWAAVINRDRSRFRIPLALHNTGAATLVVLGLRLRFVDGGAVFDWEWTMDQVKPAGDNTTDVRRPFSIEGRKVVEIVPELLGVLPGVVPEPRGYDVVVEAQTSRSGEWQQLLRFELQLGNLLNPTSYITYTNQADYLPAEDRVLAATRLAELRDQYAPR